MFLSDLSIKRRVLMTVIILMMALLGLVAYLQLPVNLFPQVEFPFITVSTVYPGAGPREIETLLSKPLEEELSTTEGLKHVRSVSREGVSLVMLEFELDQDVDVAAADVRDKVALVEPDLPDGAEKPLIQKFDINAEPIMQLAVTGDLSSRDLYLLAENTIIPALARIRGVANSEIVGGEEREILVSLDRQRLRAQRLTPGDISRAIAAANLELPSGHITQLQTEYTVRLLGKIELVNELPDLKILGPGGEEIRLGDLGRVTDTVKEIRELARFQGETSLGLIIRKRADASAVAVADGVYRAIENLEERLGGTIQIEIAEDSSEFIRGSLKEVWNNMIVGIILTAICLFLFLHDLRSTLIITVAMPTSIVSTFMLLFFFGYSINIMSMLGLALSVGILVNNSILVLENIHRYRDLGKNRREAAAVGTSEIASAVASTTLTNIVVFVPIAFMSSIVGQFFRQFAMTVVFSTIFSLFVSYTLTPMLAARFLQEKKRKRRIFEHWDSFYTRLSHRYGDLVRKLIRFRWPVVIGAIAIFLAVTFLVLPHIGAEFFPRADEGFFQVTIETPVSATLETTDAVVRRVEEMLAEIPEKEMIFTTVGKLSQMLGGSNQGVNLAEITVGLVDQDLRERSTAEVMNSIRPRLAAIPGAAFTLLETQQGGGGNEKPIQLEIRGEEIGTLNRLAGEVVLLAAGIPGAADVDTDWRTGKPEIWITPHRERASEHGVTVAAIGAALRDSLTGETSSTFRERGDEFDIRVKLDEKDRNFREQIKRISVIDRHGDPVSLASLSRIEFSDGPTTITRKDRERIVTVSANVIGTSSGEVAGALDDLLETEVDFPPGYSFYFGGEIERMKENFADIFLALGLAIILTFLMLSGILESYRYPVMIMLSLPLAMAAVFITLLLTDTTLNIFSLMAMVMLVGLVINNTIVIVDYSNLLRRQGKSIEDAIVTACAIRLRPILMANITTSVAMIPLALGIGWGAGFRAPMAIVSIGGMIGGGALALIVMPAFYVIFSSTRQRLE
ncbi:MAG: efflux RND transporter permease subunit [Candidatus Erginobacter occultus]|nr:efflux RND transporter permease subunit [Candidatus Erginobacter occultus]